MHLDEELLQRLLHGELSNVAATATREHLAGCPECSVAFAELEHADEAVKQLLYAVDHPPPTLDVQSVIRRAGPHGFRWRRWAAVFLLAVGLSSAAYALPGSPLPALAQTIAAWLRGGRSVPPEAPAPAVTPMADVAGIAVTPGAQLVILFTSRQEAGQAEISLTADSQVVVQAPSGVATFTTEEGRLVIDNRRSTATFQIRIPRSARRVEIRVAAERLFLKEGPRISTQSATQAGGLYSVSLAPSQP